MEELMTPEVKQLISAASELVLALAAVAYAGVKGGHWWLYQRNGNSPQARQVKLLERIAAGVENHHADSQQRNAHLVRTLDGLVHRTDECHTLLVKLEDRN